MGKMFKSLINKFTQLRQFGKNQKVLENTDVSTINRRAVFGITDTSAIAKAGLVKPKLHATVVKPEKKHPVARAVSDYMTTLNIDYAKYPYYNQPMRLKIH
ncbi:MAG: hypothetical protein PHX18_03000 [Candidatus Gastranaerophilales bacterium]|nr:hypothetical protein [Candidatus Gastranaerophilales bacterium]